MRENPRFRPYDLNQEMLLPDDDLPYPLRVLPTDGSKMKANASKHAAMSYDRMVKKAEELSKELSEAEKKAISEYVREGVKIDQEEDEKYGKGNDGWRLPEGMKTKKERLEKIRKFKKKLEEQGSRSQTQAAKGQGRIVIG